MSSDVDAGVMEVFLQPGEFFFGDADYRIRTLLGSCVAITMWHPRRLLGGMCHYVVPRRSRPADELDGTYAEEAVELFLRELRRERLLAQDLVVKMFGGGRQFRTGTPAGESPVSQRNVEVGLELLDRHGLRPRVKHLGGTGHRQVLLDVLTGDVWMRHVPKPDLEAA